MHSRPSPSWSSKTSTHSSEPERRQGIDSQAQQIADQSVVDVVDRLEGDPADELRCRGLEALFTPAQEGAVVKHQIHPLAVGSNSANPVVEIARQGERQLPPFHPNSPFAVPEDCLDDALGDRSGPGRQARHEVIDRVASHAVNLGFTCDNLVSFHA
jgi:hypothetical protein